MMDSMRKPQTDEVARGPGTGESMAVRDFIQGTPDHPGAFFSLCTFQNGKIYNCDLSAAQNIGARFFLREYVHAGIEGLPATPQRTLSTLWSVVSNGLPVAA